MASLPLPHDNIYGSFARVLWLRSHLHPADRILELGCGTGYAITYPLRSWGFNVVGIDIDRASIDYGRELLASGGLAPGVLDVCELRQWPGEADVIIASEVLEHLDPRDLQDVLATSWSKLAPGGRLLITTPNGHGWFELESWLWRRGLGKMLTKIKFIPVMELIKSLFCSGPVGETIPNTLSTSPHVQRFTLRALERMLSERGYTVVDVRGACLACGPLSHTMLSGCVAIQALNRAIGRRWPRIAADFYIAARKPLGGAA
jgi:2-polyprenyl-3-methyl-5-hydroxy-6-metoxy-1,4-benzoquinol methylase